MGKFCAKHVVERTTEELQDRKNRLIGLVNTGPGQRAELVRIDLELDKRAAKAAEAAKAARRAEASKLLVIGHKINLR